MHEEIKQALLTQKLEVLKIYETFDEGETKYLIEAREGITPTITTSTPKKDLSEIRKQQLKDWYRSYWHFGKEGKLFTFPLFTIKVCGLWDQNWCIKNPEYTEEEVRALMMYIGFNYIEVNLAEYVNFYLEFTPEYHDLITKYNLDFHLLLPSEQAYIQELQDNWLKLDY